MKWRSVRGLVGTVAGVSTLALAAPVAGAALPHDDVAPPDVPAGTQPVFQTPTSGTFIDGTGAVVGGWAEPNQTTTVLTAGASPLDSGSQQVGGGTWLYGDYNTGGVYPDKVCWSEYLHTSKRHSATAVMLPAGTTTDVEPAGTWAYAELSAGAGAAGECYVYWSNSA